MTKQLEFIDLKHQYQSLKDVIDSRINAVLNHGQYIMGPEVRELEESLEIFTGAKYCITVASGTEALLISLMALGIQPGDEVITTSLTFISTAEVIVLLGAKPVLVDVLPNTCNIDPSLIEAAITKQTRAIIPVSLYGQTADMDQINLIANRYGIPVIEDAAQSFGATYKDRRSCNVSGIGCTSFFPSKPLGCYGDGGAIFTSDAEIAKACQEIRIHGQSKRYVHTRIGVGGRMDTLQCAIVLAKLERFEWEISQRKLIGKRYDVLLDDAKIQRCQILPECDSVFAQYTVMVSNRDRIQGLMKNVGIPTAVHYPIPVNEQPAYAKYFDRNVFFPVAKSVSSRVMSLPMSSDLKEEDQIRVVEALIKFSRETLL